jgi:hypothetical protein
MGRQITYDEPGVTTMFSPLQLRPRALLGLVLPCFARWLAQHVTTYPAMVDSYRSAVVIASTRIDYAAPHLGFIDVPWLTVRCGLSIDPKGEWIQVEVNCAAGDRPAARISTALRVLTVAGDDSLAAQPGVLHPELRRKFTDAETHATPRLPDPHPADPVAVLPPTRWLTFISRSHAEVADQWSFIEMVELATQARERLFVENLHAPLPPRTVVGTPTRTLHAVFRRPMYVYDPCQVTTSANLDPDTSDLYFHHRIGPPDSPRPHLTVWETLEPDGWLAENRQRGNGTEHM